MRISLFFKMIKTNVILYSYVDNNIFYEKFINFIKKNIFYKN